MSDPFRPGRSCKACRDERPLNAADSTAADSTGGQYAFVPATNCREKYPELVTDKRVGGSYSAGVASAFPPLAMFDPP